MGCSSSTVTEEFGGKHSARVTDCSVNFKDGQEISCDFKEGLLSFESMSCTDDSGDHPGRPTKATHKSHMARLDKYLKLIQKDPELLNKDIVIRRVVEM